MRLLVVLQVVLHLLPGILLHRGILLLRQGIVLLVGHLVGVKSVVVPAVALVLRLAGQLCLVLWLASWQLHRLLC